VKRLGKRVAATLTAVSLVLVGGCSQAGSAEAPVAETGEAGSESADGATDHFARTRYATVWSAPPAFDLMSPEGTYVRASVESLDVSAVNGRRDAAVPGFWETLRGPAAADADEFFALGPTLPEYGVKRYEVLEHREDGPAVTVTVCAHGQQVGHRNGGGYEFGVTGARAQVLSFERSGDTAPVSAQRGRQPRADHPAVFGTWHTTGWQRGHFPGGDPCVGRPLPGVESWPQPAGGPVVLDRPPTAPESPGWPNGVGA
jgi:hypothetical protein